MSDSSIESYAPSNRWSLVSIVVLLQGAYYVMTGLWPIVDSASFERISGPKVDLWLVKTTGALIGVIGAVLLSAGLGRRSSLEVAAIGIGSAASLGGAGIIYAAQKRISPIYLLEAAAELGLIALWTAALSAARRQSARPDFQI